MFASSMCFGSFPRGFNEESCVSEVKIKNKNKKHLSSAKPQWIGNYVVSLFSINTIFKNSSAFVFSLTKKKCGFIYTLHAEGPGGGVQNKMFLMPFVSSNNSETLEKINRT